MTASREHWSKVYETKAPTETSWFQVAPDMSLSLIEQAGTAATDAIIDVGGGASTLVDHLLRRGFENVTVLDLATTALTAAQHRLGDAAKRVEWISGDVCAFKSEKTYRLWHDRAVFHFLVEEAQREAYRGVMARSLASGGHAIVATFSETGPERCSGLPVRRYSAAELSAEFSSVGEPVDSRVERHTTPWGSTQDFAYVLLRRR